MKTSLLCLLSIVFSAPVLAQSRSVWIEDYTANEVIAEVAAGRTTLLYLAGATHADGPAITLGKHYHVTREVGRRVASELGNALVLPVNPYAPASVQINATEGVYAIAAGTISISENVYGLLAKDIVNSVLTGVRKKSTQPVSTSFKTVVIMGDHGQGQETLKQVAQELDRDWKSQGVRVYWVDLWANGKNLMSEYLKQKQIPDRRHTPIDDAAELMAVDRKRVREDKIEPTDKIASPELGKLFIDFKVNAMLGEIRKLIAQGGNVP